jgi:hypothetical protein
MGIGEHSSIMNLWEGYSCDVPIFDEDLSDLEGHVLGLVAIRHHATICLTHLCAQQYTYQTCQP